MRDLGLQRGIPPFRACSGDRGGTPAWAVDERDAISGGGRWSRGCSDHPDRAAQRVAKGSNVALCLCEQHAPLERGRDHMRELFWFSVGTQDPFVLHGLEAAAEVVGPLLESR